MAEQTSWAWYRDDVDEDFGMMRSINLGPTVNKALHSVDTKLLRRPRRGSGL